MLLSRLAFRAFSLFFAREVQPRMPMAVIIAFFSSSLSEEETTAAAMKVLWAWVKKYGIPKALYVDWKNVYITQREPTVEEQLAGELPLTQFGRACHKLGIEILAAGYHKGNENHNRQPP